MGEHPACGYTEYVSLAADLPNHAVSGVITQLSCALWRHFVARSDPDPVNLSTTDLSS